MLRRQQTHRTAPILRLEQNYGPEGMTLLSSMLLWGLCEIFVGLLFFASLVGSGDGSLLTDVLLGFVIILASLALFRSRQLAPTLHENAAGTLRAFRRTPDTSRR